MFYSIFSVFVHLSYCVLFAVFYKDMDEITESLQKLYERVDNQSKSEEVIAKEEIRIKEMQDKIDELVEHQRIFDILLTRYEARIIELEGPPKAAEEKNTAQDDSVAPSQDNVNYAQDTDSHAKSYVEYEPYN